MSNFLLDIEELRALLRIQREDQVNIRFRKFEVRFLWLQKDQVSYAIVQLE